MRFLSLEKKLNESSKCLAINGLNSNEWAILFKSFFRNSNSFKKNVFLFAEENEAESFYTLIKNLGNTVYYPDIGSDIYSTMNPSEFNLVKRFSILSQVSKKPDSFNIVSTFGAANLIVPPKDFFDQQSFSISITDVISPSELAEKLTLLGFKRNPTIEEPGTFSIKGEIFDIYPISENPVRLQYFDDMVEDIVQVDSNTLKSMKDKKIETLKIDKTQFSILNKKYINNFRNNFPRPVLSEKNKVHYRENILKKLNNGSFFGDYPLFIKYFTNQNSSLFDHVENFKIHVLNEFNLIQNYENFIEQNKIQFDLFSREIDDIIKPKPEDIFSIPPNLSAENVIKINDIKIHHNLEADLNTEININKNDVANLLKPMLGEFPTKPRAFHLSLLIKEKINRSDKVYIFYTTSNARREIEYNLNVYIEDQNIISKVSWVEDLLTEGFYYINENTLFLSETDFFQKKVKKAKSTKQSIPEDLFADQLSSLSIGDYVIHKDHGIGKYLGVQTLELNESKSDFLVLEYKDSDKVYVPVYKLNLIQKHAGQDSIVSLANLKTKKFDQAKSKAKQAVKKLAFDLLELQARRKLKKGFQFSEPDHTYNEFSLSFAFTETPDQIQAIDDVIEDMTSEKPMDRLVCGDVGFGKTEVAMRAAFKAVLDNKQVGVLVPTTVLTFQHYNSFIQRFKNFPVNIEYISRFKTPKQVNEILENLKEGKVDILIGTHKILSEKVKFKDLGLLVIDEEQRFGVGHKEKLKLLRENVDTLTLTATPIPRTLQMSFLGIKDLSIIKTPPPKRQSIKTYIIKQDTHTLKLALEKELARGGQVFVVHNRVNDIEIFTSKIRDLVPDARIIYAHGQLPERDLEKRISDFYNYKYDILISTTIIESGIDIPRANTMIIDQANMYGLSQLHQLRGRIGRSDKKAYAYFVIPDTHNLSEVAAKRLKALQTYADLGSGFSLATSDLEIRGSGDILGAEQSGHIGSIGLELYMELLQDCIRELKGEVYIERKNIEIITPYNALIPDNYIEDPGQRLKFYKKISNSNSFESLKSIEEDIVDQYGKSPEELENLIIIIRARIYLQSIGILSLKVKNKSILLKFDEGEMNKNPALREKVLGLFMQRPKIYKINPDYSINCIFKDKINVDTLLDFAKYLADEIG